MAEEEMIVQDDGTNSQRWLAKEVTHMSLHLREI